MLVRVTLPDGHHFLTTLSPNPLSYNSVWKGVSRERYLEIDTSFAKQLGITAPNIEVGLCAPLNHKISIRMCIVVTKYY